MNMKNGDIEEVRLRKMSSEEATPEVEDQLPEIKIHTRSFWSIVLIFAVLGVGLIVTGELLREVWKPNPSTGWLVAVSVLQAVGVGFVTSTFVSAASDILLRKQMVNDFGERSEYYLRKTRKESKEFRESFVNDTLQSCSTYGLRGIVDSLDLEEFFLSAEGGDVVCFHDTHAPNSSEWIKQVQTLAERGVKFRFLALDPKSTDVPHAQAELETHPQYGGRSSFKSDLEQFVDKLSGVWGKLTRDKKRNMKVRTFEGLVSSPFYLICKGKEEIPVRAFTSYFLGKPTYDSFPHIEWTRGTAEHGGFMGTLKEFFDSKWERNKNREVK